MTVLEDEKPFVPKLAIWQATKAAYRDTFGNLGIFATTAAVPFGLSLGLDIAIPEEGADLGLGMLRLVLSSMFAVLFEVVWYRHLLSDGATARPTLIPPIDRRLKLFAGYSLLLSLLFAPWVFVQAAVEQTTLPGPTVLATLGVILFLVAAYLSVRFAFIYPWIALDAPERLAESWRRTRKNGLRIIIALLLIAVPFVVILFAGGFALAIIASGLAAQFESGTFEGSTYWVVLIASNVLLFLFYALSCAVLVHAFCALTGWQRDRHELLERFE